MKNRSAPAAAVVPVLIYEDVGEAIEWLCRAFGFTERLRAVREGVIAHAQLEIGEGAVMLGRQGGAYRAPRGNEVAAYVHVAVEDVDEHFERARRNGAHILEPPADMPFGVRQYTARDLALHWWTFSQNMADVDPAVWGAQLPGSD